LIVYVDTSFLVAAYVVDAQSLVVANLLASHPHLCLTPFHCSEAANAIYRQVFTGRLSLPGAKTAWQSFEADTAAGVWQTVDFPTLAWDVCIGLALRFSATIGVRTLDSLHVACALELKADRFWTFDERQARLAEAVGLDTKA